MKLLELVLRVPAASGWLAAIGVAAFVTMVGVALHGLGMSGPLSLGAASVGALCALVSMQRFSRWSQRVTFLMLLGATLWAGVEAVVGG